MFEEILGAFEREVWKEVMWAVRQKVRLKPLSKKTKLLIHQRMEILLLSNVFLIWIQL